MSLIEDMQARHHDALDREAQAWMAAAGAAVGFALHESSKATWNMALAFAGCAVMLWCGSFAAGIFRIAAHRNSLRVNLGLLMARAQRATDEQIKPLFDLHERQADKQKRWRSVQLWLLFAGAVAFLAANITGAWLRHIEPSSDTLAAKMVATRH